MHFTTLTDAFGQLSERLKELLPDDHAHAFTAVFLYIINVFTWLASLSHSRTNRITLRF